MGVGRPGPRAGTVCRQNELLPGVLLPGPLARTPRRSGCPFLLGSLGSFCQVSSLAHSLAGQQGLVTGTDLVFGAGGPPDRCLQPPG